MSHLEWSELDELLEYWLWFEYADELDQVVEYWREQFEGTN